MNEINKKNQKLPKKLVFNFHFIQKFSRLKPQFIQVESQIAMAVYIPEYENQFIKYITF